MYHEWISSHVQLCLQDIWSKSQIVKDVDGDFPYRFETAACYVRVERGDPAMVRIFAIAATDVPRSAKVLAELNEVNASSRTAHVYWDHGHVLVEYVLLAVNVDRTSLAHGCAAVGTVAKDIGSLLAAVFGGNTPYSACVNQMGEGAA